MGKAILSPKERWHFTLSHQTPDRPPIDFHSVEIIRDRLQHHFKNTRKSDNSLEVLLNVDFRYIQTPYIGQRPPIPAGCEGVDMWGAGYSRHNEAFPQEVSYLPWANIESEDQLKDIPWPSINDFDFSTIYEQCKNNASYVTVLGQAGCFDVLNGVGARRRGYEKVMFDIMTQDKIGIALIDRSLDFHYELLKRGLEAGRGLVDVLYIGEDCGCQNGPIFPPEIFKSFFVPRLKRFTDLAHHYHAACRLHSCGSTRQIIPFFINDIRLDILDAVQPEPAGMEPAGLKRDFGDRITFSGMLSLQKTFARGNPDDCRKEAEYLIKTIGKDGGYIFTPPNTFTMDTPIANILAAYETVNE